MENKNLSINSIIDEMSQSDPDLKNRIHQQRKKLATAVALHDARVSAGLTQSELANLAHTSQKTVAKIEQGDNVTFDKFYSLIFALGKDVEIKII